MPAIIDLKRCNGCGICAQICPLDVIKMENGVPKVMYPEECWHCGACRLECPRRAIEIRVPLPLMLLYVEVEQRV
jgi:adenylylsulfate reductase subunit B